MFPIVLELVLVLVLDLWTLTIGAFPVSKEVENENDDYKDDWKTMDGTTNSP